MTTNQLIASIDARRNVMQALASVRIRIVAHHADVTWALESFSIYADAASTVRMSKDVTPCTEGSKAGLYGKLIDAVDDINAYIAKQFKPLIEEQKAEIMKLLKLP